MPAGDLISDDTIEELRCEPGKKVKEVLLIASICELDQLNEAHFSAICPAEPRRVRPGINILKPENGSQEIRVQYVLRFEPPLTDEPVTVRCRQTLFGPLLSSHEAHRLARQKVTPHDLLHTIRWPCEQLILRVRVGNGAWPAPGLRIHCEDPLEQPAPWEEGTDHVITYAHPPLFGQVPEALVAVYRPRLGYSYGPIWDVPQDDLHSADMAKLRRSERELLRPRPEQEGVNRAAASNFLQRTLEAIERIGADAAAADLKACACLFAFDRDRGELVSIAQQACAGFGFNHVRWGRDIIGTAFQRQAAVFFSKSQRVQEEKKSKGEVAWEVSRDVPEAVQVLFAIPLPGLIPKDWPIAILALLSTDAASGMHELLERQDAVESLHKQISTLWAYHIPAIMGKEVKFVAELPDTSKTGAP